MIFSCRESSEAREKIQDADRKEIVPFQGTSLQISRGFRFFFFFFHHAANKNWRGVLKCPPRSSLSGSDEDIGAWGLEFEVEFVSMLRYKIKGCVF